MFQKSSIRTTRLQLECLEDRCTPSAMLGDPWALGPVHLGGPQTHVAPRDAAKDESVITRKHVELVRLNFQCSADLKTGQTTVTGFATNLGHWTGTGQVSKSDINLATDRAEVSGTVTIFTANGDKLFVSFSASWKLSTGKGTEVVTTTGGTGRYAGAYGVAFMNCTMTVDLAAQTISCNCQGFGFLVTARR